MQIRRRATLAQGKCSAAKTRKLIASPENKNRDQRETLKGKYEKKNSHIIYVRHEHLTLKPEYHRKCRLKKKLFEQKNSVLRVNGEYMFWSQESD